jgi:hypothetical protein
MSQPTYPTPTGIPRIGDLKPDFYLLKRNLN